MSKALSQNAIGRALNLSSSGMVKLKKQGCPMDSVESVRAWRQKRQNIAARKPEPEQDRPQVIRAIEVKPDGSEIDESQDEARTRREIAEANLAEMKESEQRGDLIREVNGRQIRSTRDLAEALKSGASVWRITIQRGPQTITAQFRL